MLTRPRWFSPHIADADLLLAAEGELAPARLAAVDAHLAGCAQCRQRSAMLEGSMAAFAVESSLLPPIQQPRRASPVAAVVAAALAVALAGGGALLYRLLPPGASTTAIDQRLPLPDPSLTPGAATASEPPREALCAAGAATIDDEQTPVPPALARRVFARYGIANPRPGAYELDYLITPALGGAAGDERNLWPQPYREGVWTARVKDALEDRLAALVCSGKLDLATAQRDLAANWVDAYKKYFRTAQPRGDHVAFVKDRPWEGY